MSQDPYINVFTLLLLCLIASSRTFDCPDGPGCSHCNNIEDAEYNIFCRTPSSDLSTTTEFLIRYIPNDSAAKTYINSPDWDNFHLSETMKIQHINAIYFKMCKLPKNYPLSIVVKKLVVENIDELNFQSYNNLTTTLSRRTLADFHNLTKLILASNKLANISDDLFNDLTHLKILNILDNNLNDWPRNFLNIPIFLPLELGSDELRVSTSRIDDVGDVLQRGEHVWCKIISVGEDGKIGLSMKVVNQGNGMDLDPSGIEMHRDEQKRKTFGTSQKKIIELQAVLNTTCGKCGTRGHLSRDCFATPDGKKYELLPETEEDSVAQPLPPPPPPPPPQPPMSQVEPQLKSDKNDKKAQSKKLKKRKKSKKSKHKSESSSDNSSNDDERKKKKKKKKHSKEAKRKKRKHSESSSDESSDSVLKEKHSKKCKHSKSKHSD